MGSFFQVIDLKETNNRILHPFLNTYVKARLQVGKSGQTPPSNNYLSMCSSSLTLNKQKHDQFQELDQVGGQVQLFYSHVTDLWHAASASCSFLCQHISFFSKDSRSKFGYQNSKSVLHCTLKMVGVFSWSHKEKWLA